MRNNSNLNAMSLDMEQSPTITVKDGMVAVTAIAGGGESKWQDAIGIAASFSTPQWAWRDREAKAQAADSDIVTTTCLFGTSGGGLQAHPLAQLYIQEPRAPKSGVVAALS
jgi:hypothetical protein